MDKNSREFAVAIRTPVDNLLDVKENYLPIVRSAMPEFFYAHRGEVVSFLEKNIAYCPDDLSFISLMKEFIWSGNYRNKDSLLAKLDGMEMYLLENGASRQKENSLEYGEGVIIKRPFEPIESSYEALFSKNSGGISKLRKPNRWSFD
jgi:hypothetical protein